jgi:hypothetical protein
MKQYQISQTLQKMMTKSSNPKCDPKFVME